MAINASLYLRACFCYYWLLGNGSDSVSFLAKDTTCTSCQWVITKRRQNDSYHTSSVSNLTGCSLSLAPNNSDMITVFTIIFNHVTQQSYNELVATLDLTRIECKCGRIGCFIFYGHYSRMLKDCNETLQLVIQRLQCTCCKRTHAILPECIVPYSQIPVDTQQKLAETTAKDSESIQILESNPDITEADAYHIRKMYKKHWQQRLLVIGLILSMPIQKLTANSFSAFHRQFMQIRRGVNLHIFTTNTG